LVSKGKGRKTIKESMGKGYESKETCIREKGKKTEEGPRCFSGEVVRKMKKLFGHERGRDSQKKCERRAERWIKLLIG